MSKYDILLIWEVIKEELSKKKLFKRLFCRHQYERIAWHRHKEYKISWYECEKCGKIRCTYTSHSKGICNVKVFE